VVIIGGGTVGIAMAARLRKASKALKLTVVDPASRHYYQPIWTLVGGGLATFEESDHAMEEYMPKGVTWLKERVSGIDAAGKTVSTEEGTSLTYDALVVAPGIRLVMDEVDGLEEALEQDARVWTNYSPKYVTKGKAAIDGFEGGSTWFTFPNSPVKCGGGPQKIMYIAEQWLEKRGQKATSTVNYVAPGGKIFGVPKYCETLEGIVEQRGIATHFFQHLVAVDHANSTITLEHVETKERTTHTYDLLHVTPPQRAFPFVAESGIANDAGFVNVDKATLQHVEHPEIFSAGDASSLPTAKTGAAVRKQAPILVANLLAHLKGESLKPKYDGYTSCPLVVSHKHVVLAEFGYDGAILESFPFNQAKPRRSMYFLKRNLLPGVIYNRMMKGKM